MIQFFFSLRLPLKLPSGVLILDSMGYRCTSFDSLFLGLPLDFPSSFLIIRLHRVAFLKFPFQAFSANLLDFRFCGFTLDFPSRFWMIRPGLRWSAASTAKVVNLESQFFGLTLTVFLDLPMFRTSTFLQIQHPPPPPPSLLQLSRFFEGRK